MAYPELLVSTIKTRVRRFMGWMRDENWPADVDVVQVVNEVGDWLTNLHTWNYLQRPVVELDIVADQEFIALPDDFAAILDVLPSRSGARTISMQDSIAVARARAGFAPGGTLLIGALASEDPDGTGAAEWRIDIGPIPIASEDGALQLVYRAGWVPVTATTSKVSLPGFMHMPLLRAVAIYMKGWEHDAQGSLEDRLDRFVQSSVIQSAIDRDDQVQTQLGPMMGTAESIVLGSDGDTYTQDRTNVQITTG